MAEGLLDWIKTPEGQGLLSAAFGGLAGARRGAPLNSIGNAGMAGLLGYAGAQDRATLSADQAFKAEQQNRQRKEWEMADKISALGPQFMRPAVPATEATPGTADVNAALPPDLQIGALPGQKARPAQPASFDLQGYGNALMGVDPMKGVAFQQTLAKENPFGKVDPKDFTPESLAKFALTKNYSDLLRQDKLQFVDTGGAQVGVNPFSGKPQATISKTGNPYADLVVADGAGGFKPNDPLVNVKRSIASAGAPSVNVNTDKSYFGNVADGMAKNDVALIEAARTAPDRVASARRVMDILKQNPITGTAAETRLGINKAFATAGLVDPKVANATEALVTELASQTLDSIKTSGLGSGQGFTDKDRTFLQDAKSGRIEMTPSNIERIARLNEQSALQSIKRGNSVISKLRMNPKSGDMGASLELIPEPASAPSTPAPPAPDLAAAARAELARRRNGR